MNIAVRCPYCGKSSQIPNDSKVNEKFICPFCNREWVYLGMNQLSITLISVIVCIIIGIGVFWGLNNFPKFFAARGVGMQVSDVYTDFGLDAFGDYALLISGKVKNTGTKTISDTSLKITVWNESNNNIIGDRIIFPTASELRPGDITTFSEKISLSQYAESISWKIFFRKFYRSEWQVILAKTITKHWSK